MTTIFTGPDEVSIFQAISIKHGLGLMKKGLKPGRGWTPTAVRKTVEKITGNKYKRGEYDRPIADLEEWIQAKKAERDAAIAAAEAEAEQ